MPAPLAARHLRSHQVRLARAIARQVQATVPRYRAVDEQVLERNIATIMRGVMHLLEHGDETKLMPVVENVVQMRALGGFTASDFIVACMCFLPVGRRFLMERCATPEEGLRAYEEVEAIALPFLGRFITIFERAREDAQAFRPGGFFENFYRESEKLKAVEIEAVTGGDDDENSPG